MRLLKRDVRTLKRKVTKIEVKIDAIHKELMGNGSPGLIKEWNRFKGGLSVFKVLAGGGGLLGILAFIFQLILWVGG